MNARRVLTLCLLLACSCMAQQDATELRKKAEASSGIPCVRLYLQASRVGLEEADRHFAASDSKAAHEAMDAAVHDVGHAVECSLHTPKYQKNTEIELRKLSRRITAMEHSIEAEERSYLVSSRAEVERQRDRLLHSLFGDAAGDGTENKH
jgi:uncharacterized membrane-anchored protein